MSSIRTKVRTRRLGARLGGARLGGARLGGARLVGALLGVTLCLIPAYGWAVEDDSVAEAHPDAHEAGEAAPGEHDAHHEVNWYYGFFGEDEEIDHPTFAKRPVGMPAPVLAQVLNVVLLFGAIYFMARSRVAEGVKKRREAILKSMNDAAKMRDDAAEELASYEQRLAAIEQEIQRTRAEMREVAETEREQILRDAKERRARMERDAKLLIEQELKGARERLLQEAARGAVRSAEELLRAEITASDQDRLSEDHIGSLKQGLARFHGGRA